jgi:hypothetical protein
MTLLKPRDPANTLAYRASLVVVLLGVLAWVLLTKLYCCCFARVVRPTGKRRDPTFFQICVAYPTTAAYAFLAATICKTTLKRIEDVNAAALNGGDPLAIFWALVTSRNLH